MEDKTFQTPRSAPEEKPKIRASSEEWTADLRKELDEIGRLIEETNKLLGLPPMDQLASASSRRR